MPDHPRAVERNGMRFWLRLGALIILGGIVALIVFMFIGAALLTWGFIGVIIFIGAVLLVFAWFYDRRQARSRAEWEELGAE
jgi:Flp pilus assembly protein TadB